jgi:hypothetical protein
MLGHQVAGMLGSLEDAMVDDFKQVLARVQSDYDYYVRLQSNADQFSVAARANPLTVLAPGLNPSL